MLNSFRKFTRNAFVRNSFCCNHLTRRFSTSYEDKYVAATSNAIIEKCHPSDVTLFKRTLSTFVKSSPKVVRKKRYDMIMSGLSFRATHEMKTVLTWFKNMLESSDEIPLEISEDPKYSIAKQKCFKAFLSFRRKRDALKESVVAKKKGKVTLDDTEKIQLERIIANIPPQVVVDITKFLNQFQVHITDASNGRVVNQLIDDLLFTAEYHGEEVMRLLDMMNLPVVRQRHRPGYGAIQKHKIQAHLQKQLKMCLALRSELINLPDKEEDKNTRRKHGSFTDKFQTDVSVEIKAKGSSWTSVDVTKREEQEDIVPYQHHDLDVEKAIPFDELNVNDEAGHKIEVQRVVRTEVPIEELCSGMEDELAGMLSAERKVLITNIPPSYRPSELHNAMRRIGDIQILRIFSADKFEADIPPPPEMVKDLNKGVKKLAQVQQAVVSDAYAFVVFENEESFQKILRDDVSIFGMCLKGYRCKVIDAKKVTSITVELVGSSTTMQWLDTLGNYLGSDFEMRCNECYIDSRPAFLTLQFSTHEDAWRVFMLLERAAQEFPDLNFQVSWIKSSWYFKILSEYRKMRRKSNSYLQKILKEVEENDTQGDKKESVNKILSK